MKKIVLLNIFSICLISYGQEISQLDSFSIINLNRDIIVNGDIEKVEWNLADSIVGLNAEEACMKKDQTVFKSFYSDDYLYFCFNIVDTTIITHDFKEELTVAQEDRVELFFSASPNLDQYYCIEIDPLGRVLDYSARYFRDFNESWNLNKINIAAKYSNKGYVVEGRIPISELKKIEIEQTFYLGIFRADFKNNNLDDVDWYSWVDIKGPIYDFHIPAAFGICNFKIVVK